MRLYKTIVHLYDKKKAEITGNEDDASNDVARKCAIDLDEISGMWEGFEEGVIVSMKSGERYWLKEMTFDKMFHVWQGTTPEEKRFNAAEHREIFDKEMKDILGI